MLEKNHSFLICILLLFKFVSAGGVFRVFFLHSNCSKTFFIITVFCSRVRSILYVVDAFELYKLFLDLLEGKGIYK